MAANSSDEIFNFKCSSCAYLNRKSEAVKYCVECQGYCCQTCVNTHTAFAALRNHTLLDKACFKSTVFTTELPSVPTERCGKHELKILDMYCGNHDLVVCTTCMALEHRICNDVQSIPDFIDTIFKNSDTDETYHMLHEKIKTLQKLKETRKANLQELEESKDKTLNDIQEFRKEIVAIVESIKKESIKEAENEYRKKELLLTEEKKNVEDKLKDLEGALDRLNDSKGNKAQQFVLMKAAQTKIMQSDTMFASFDKQTEATIEFSANSNILEFLRQLQTFGKFTGRSTVSLIPRTTAYSIKGNRELNIKLHNDSQTCCVEGACLTDDGLLLLADRYNNKLKRADIVRKSIVDYCDLSACPDDVCCISKLEAAVSLSDNTIQFVSLDGKMTLTRKLKIDHRCYGVAYKNGRLYTATASCDLYIHDMTGNLLQTISSDRSGNKLFQQNQHVVFSDSGDKMFVADYQKGLITLDMEGNLIARYDSDSELNNAHDICTDRRGNLFVSGKSSHTVLQIAQDGKRKVGVVVRESDGMRDQYCVCFDPLKTILIVTNFPGDTIKLFDLQ